MTGNNLQTKKATGTLLQDRDRERLVLAREIALQSGYELLACHGRGRRYLIGHGRSLAFECEMGHPALLNERRKLARTRGG